MPSLNVIMSYTYTRRWASPVSVGDAVGKERCTNPACNTLVASVERRGCPEETEALVTLSKSSAYARSLRFLGARGQVEKPACGAIPGTPGYTEAVRLHGVRIFAGEHEQLEVRPRDFAIIFDAYLAVTTAHKYRIWSRDHCLAFVGSDSHEGLLAEFVQSLGRKVLRMGNNGIQQLVQVRKVDVAQPLL